MIVVSHQMLFGSQVRKMRWLWDSVNDGLILQCILKNRMFEFGLVSADQSKVQW